MYRIIFLIVLFTLKGEANKCVPLDFGNGSPVCVCNSTYCDSPPQRESPKNNTFHAYVSSKEGHRLDFSTGQFGPQAEDSVKLFVNSKNRYQTIKGFGGAFTDSTGINMKKLSNATQKVIMEQYFGETGCQYAFGRVPIGGTDFSVRPYTLDDCPGDTDLKNFALQPEDWNYKIPYIKHALEINPNLKMFASPWSAPPWMKTNGKINGFGFLKTENYQTYANYLVKFLKKYNEQGIKMWGMTTGNEPLDGLFPLGKLNSMAWTPGQLAKWVAENLGPSIRNSEFNETQIMILDDQRLLLPMYVQLFARNKVALNYVDGIAVHWYTDDLVPGSVIKRTHELFPDKFILMTEACTGSKLWDWPKVILGSWDRAEQYILDIIENIVMGTVGWIDWNLVLDKDGGPNWIKNFVDAPILAIPEKDQFYKQPMYYAMFHASRFVRPGSVRADMTETGDIKTMAFKTLSGETVAILCNRNSNPQNITISDTNKADSINLEMPGKSICTIIYNE